MRTIRVTGKGQIKVRPDTTRITLTLTGLCPEYGEALRRSADETERVRTLLAGFGFARTDLKTLSFRVDTEHESYKDKKGAYQQRFVGYRFNHSMKVEFPSDNERLGKLLYALALCPAKPEFRLSYTVGDPEAVKNELLGKAVSDSARKASVMAKAAGVALKDVQSIDYSWGQIDIDVYPVRTPMAMYSLADCANEDARLDMDIEPDDVELSDTVTVVWEIG